MKKKLTPDGKLKDAKKHPSERLQLKLEKSEHIKEFSENLQKGKIGVSSAEFNFPTTGNHVELLVDGHDAFKRYYEVNFLFQFSHLFQIMMQAQHSIKILAWDISFDVGLVTVDEASTPRPVFYDGSAKWITLEVSSSRIF